MSIMELGALGEFVGSILVLATLIYLVIQVRQNTRGINSASYVNAAQLFNQINALVIADDSLSKLMVRGHTTPDELNEDERTRYLVTLRAYNNAHMALEWSYREGTLPTDSWEVYRNSFAAMLATPGGEVLIKSFEYETPDYTDKLKDLRNSITPTRWTEYGYQPTETEA
jgi:hypothetical protein